jgi:putative MFS transporter
VGYVLAPFGVGLLAERADWGAAIRPTVFFLLVALGLIFWLLPETRGHDLDDSQLIE